MFVPYFRPQVWGGRALGKFLNRELPPRALIGESWELSAHELHVSCVQSGHWQGDFLTDLWNQHRADLLGRAEIAGERPFPWLIKWLDCADRFSVQVHPNDAIAKQLLREPCGKTESWVIMHVEPSALVYAGFKPGVTRDELIARLRAGTVVECLHSFHPNVGDCIHLPAGTVHAASGGVLMAEVQQNSDATFRLFDWNRVDSQGQPRVLHIGQALQAIDFEIGQIRPLAPQSLKSPSSGVQQELLVACPHYTLHRFQLENSWSLNNQGFSVWIQLEGNAELRAERLPQPLSLKPGDVVLIPALVEQYTLTCVSKTIRMLQVKLPELDGR